MTIKGAIMQFESEKQESVYKQVGAWMKELFGEETILVRDDSPVYGVRFGSAFVQVSVYSWGDDVTVTTRSYVVYGAEMNLDLAKYLLRKNEEMRFGAFGIDAEGDIEFEHTIVGSTAQPEELRASVYAVMKVADQYDDEIVAQWGGQRALDRMEKKETGASSQ
jgi:hypothetical protein